MVSWAAFFSQVLNSNYNSKWHYSYSSCSFFIFFFLLNIYVSWYIYCYTDTTNFTIFSQLLTCVNALKHCSYNALVSWAAFFSQVLNSNYSSKWHSSYSSYRFFFFFLVIGFFFLLNIYVSWYIYCYIDTINFTIFS